jgi:MFS family permease
MVSDSFWYLLLAQFFAGLLWAAYELATFLLLLETIPQHERTSVMSLYNMANAGAMVAGATVGGFVLHQLGLGHAAYLWVFGGSLVLRAGTIALLARLHPPACFPDAVRIIPTAVRPSSGAMSEPVLPTPE